ncbi:ABC transporter substrate-binding protein [Collinsella sp. AGMB00827]|uniref:ABC transporter substrate-binding protein n=1 Tax=Collinsella ureilytica TaxID=2869515 RepID=A0ABS7MK80_9ACTN|nr:ABC transporter substrate-binding protein [Collinsella urealyticum]MBY4797687.1 ABC transporter substrate-binding protein [Collinsella urealyticum]
MNQINTYLTKKTISRRGLLGGLGALALGGAALSLAGCGDSSGAGSGTGGGGAGGTLAISLAASPAYLDPIKYTGVYESQVINSVCDTLVQYSMDLSKIAPCLATVWEISEDGMTYTFDLRSDVVFQKGEYQDGRAMTAEDVKFSLERSAQQSALNRLAMLDHCTVISDTRVECVLKTPSASFLAALTDAGNAIVPKEEVEGWGDAFGEHLIGTGPFVLKAFIRDQQTELARNDTYWGAKPKLDGVVWKVITDNTQAANALFTGDVDMVTDLSGESLQTVKANDAYEVEEKQALHISYIYMNNANGPTADQRVRKAILMAVKREDLVAATFPYGGGREAKLPLPAESWGYDASAEELVPAYDPEEAKRLLAEAGHANGLTLNLYITNAPDRVDMATVFQQQLKKNLNIDVKINTSDWGTFSATAASGTADIYAMSWTWYPDPYFFLNQMFHTTNIGALGNGAGFNDPEVDALLDEANRVIDQDERAKVYKQALRKIVAKDPILVYGSRDMCTGLNKLVEGYVPRADGHVRIVNDEVNVGKRS